MKKKWYIIWPLIALSTTLRASEKPIKKSSSAPNSPRVTAPPPRIVTHTNILSPRNSHLPPLPPKTPGSSPAASTATLQRSPSAGYTRRTENRAAWQSELLKSRTPSPRNGSSSLPTRLSQPPSATHSENSVTSPEHALRRLSTTSTTSTTEKAEQFDKIAQLVAVFSKSPASPLATQITQLTQAVQIHADAAQTAEERNKKLSQEILEKCTEIALLKCKHETLTKETTFLKKLLKDNHISIPLLQRSSRPGTPQSPQTMQATGSETDDIVEV